MYKVFYSIYHYNYEQFVKFDYGSKDMDPINEMKFYNKDQPNIPLDKPPYVSHMLPKSFCETYIRVYCKNLDDQTLKLAARYIITFLY